MSDRVKSLIMATALSCVPIAIGGVHGAVIGLGSAGFMWWLWWQADPLETL